MATSPTNKKDAAPFQDSASQCGGATGTRTPDPLLAKQMLSQLSYRPRANMQKAVASKQNNELPTAYCSLRWWAYLDSNQGPRSYQDRALTN